ncbi:MAG TPA: M56 family metallopeptidase [Fimbriimonadaceae bacterium]|nr:M56 family metallopeptidase [Fimbriimonadaceae bacterium]
MTQAWIDSLLRACLGGSMAIALVWVATRLWRGMPAKAKALLWLFAFARLFLGLFLLVGLPILRPVEPEVLPMSAPQAIVTYHYGAYQPAGIDWPAILFGAWVLGVLAFAVLGLVAHARIRRLAKRSQPIASLSERYGIDVRAHNDVPVPLVFGLFRPCVLLPSWHLSGLSGNEVDMVIEHELAHVRRWDSLSSLFVFLNHALFFFNPAVWIARREWQFSREAACDEYAIANTACSPGDYAAMLVSVSSGRPSLAALSAAPTFRTLKRRINDMKTPRTISNSGKVLLPLLLGLSALGSVPVALKHQDAKVTSPDVKVTLRRANFQEIRVAKEIPLILVDPEGRETRVTIKAADKQLLQVVQEDPLVIRDTGGRVFWLSANPLNSNDVGWAQGSPPVGEAIAGHVVEGHLVPQSTKVKGLSQSGPIRVKVQGPVFLTGSDSQTRFWSDKGQGRWLGGSAPRALSRSTRGSVQAIGGSAPKVVSGSAGVSVRVVEGTAPRMLSGNAEVTVQGIGGTAPKVVSGSAGTPVVAIGGKAPMVMSGSASTAVVAVGGKIAVPTVREGSLGAVEVSRTVASPEHSGQEPTSVTIVLKGGADQSAGGLASSITMRVTRTEIKKFLAQLSHVSGVRIKTEGITSARLLEAKLEVATLRDVLDTVTKVYKLSWSQMPDGSIEVKQLGR